MKMQLNFIVILLSVVFVLAGPVPSELNRRMPTAQPRVDERFIGSRNSAAMPLPLKREIDMDVPAAMAKLSDGAIAYSFK
ncbi:hypothetical protein DFS33DRAFT_1307626 [Desarmillaria ectypa]|nr:hypothetical protein DFS33DRAFT_1307626 [Desarmillaria ectypa]